MDRSKPVAEERTLPSSEVLEKPVRRRFTVDYKAKILAEADACTETGQLGELLRRNPVGRLDQEAVGQLPGVGPNDRQLGLRVGLLTIDLAGLSPLLEQVLIVKLGRLDHEEQPHHAEMERGRDQDNALEEVFALIWNRPPQDIHAA